MNREAQLDFSAGVQRNVAPHLIDERACYQILQGLLADDGSIFKRGGSVNVTNAAFGSALRSAWDGWLLPGRRTLLASTTAFGGVEADGKTPFSLGGAGFSPLPKGSVAFQDMLFIGGGTIYGGSRKAADYSTGTVKVTKGSKIVTGVETFFAANVDAGMLLRISPEGRIYVVASVDSDTQLTLRDAYEAETGEGVYSLKRLETATGPYKAADLYVVAGQRLIVLKGSEVWVSEIDKPHLFEATVPPLETKVENVHHLPEGTQIIAGASIGVDRVLVFHTQGVTVIGNLALSIVDGLGNTQHTIDLLTRDVVAWGNVGIAAFSGALVVPAVDDVYLIDGSGSPVPLAESIAPLYREHVRDGLTPGVGQTFKNHYFLPILDPTGAPQDLMVCRLDRPYESRGRRYFPWTFQSGAGAKVCGLTQRRPAGAGERPQLFGAASDGRLVDLATYFEPSGEVKNDHDGSTAPFSIILRDYPSADGLALARVRRLVLLYELEAGFGEHPLISAEIGLGVRLTGEPTWDDVTWDDFEWADPEDTEFEQLEYPELFAVANAGAAADMTQNAWEWFTNEFARYTRYRIQCADPVAKLTIRGVEIFAAQVGGVRLTKVA